MICLTPKPSQPFFVFLFQIYIYVEKGNERRIYIGIKEKDFTENKCFKDEGKWRIEQKKNEKKLF